MASITINWTPTVTNSISQDIQYKESTSSTWITFSTVSPTDATATITGVSDNIVYDVRVVNNCQFGTIPSTISKVINLTCPVLTLTPGGTDIQYTFNGVTTVNQYVVQLTDSSNNLITSNNETPASTVTGQFTGLTSATTYNVRIVVVSDQGNKICNNQTTTTSTTIIPCGSSASYSGGQSFPTEYTINLGPDLGTVNFNGDAISVPDKFIIIYDGVEVINTGYRGDSSQQSSLDAELISRGLPTETITGPGVFSTSFNKTSSTTTATLQVWAPLSGTAWSATLGCPQIAVCGVPTSLVATLI